jgi:hypothetical protein
MVVVATVIALPPRSRYRPGMLLRPRPSSLADQAPPPPPPGSAAVAHKLARDMEQRGGRVSEVIWGETRIVGRTRILLAK